MKLKYNPQDVVKAISIKFPVIEQDYLKIKQELDTYYKNKNELVEYINSLLNSTKFREELQIIKKSGWFSKGKTKSVAVPCWNEGDFTKHSSVKSVTFEGNTCYLELRKDYIKESLLEDDNIDVDFYPSCVFDTRRGERLTQCDNFILEARTLSIFPSLRLYNNDYNRLKDILESCNTSAKEVYFTEDEMRLFKRNGVVL